MTSSDGLRPTDRLERLVTDAGVPPRQVKGAIAKACGISYQAVAQWFSGDTKQPTADNLAAVCEKYNGNLMWVTTGRGKMHNPPADLVKLANDWNKLSVEEKEAAMALIRRK